MARTKYDLMRQSEYTDVDGNPYADLATFDIDEFRVNVKPRKYKLTYGDCMRFDKLIYQAYDSFALYDDVTLFLNNIVNISDTDENFEKVVNFYDKSDIDTFYSNNQKG